MNRARQLLSLALENILPWAVLLLLLIYTYARFVRSPYGLHWAGPNATVTKIFVSEREPTIHVGDQILRVGSTTIDEYRSDLRRVFFDGFEKGDYVPVTVRRNGEVVSTLWRLPGTNAGEVRDQFVGPWFAAYFFWLAGTLTVLVLRPRDERRTLLAMFNYITSIWLVVSSGLSAFHIWYSAIVLRMAIWLSLPIYLHLHWVFPRPLGRLPANVIRVAYAAAIGLAIAQWFQIVPPRLYLIALLLAVAGSFALLLVHRWRQPDMRRELGLLLSAATLAVAPLAVVSAIATFTDLVPPAASLALMSFPLLPVAYLYAAYRRQLGDLEVRVNRLISIYAFLILLGLATVLLVSMAASMPVYSPEQALIIGVVASAAATAISLVGFPIFQRFMERRVLGIRLPSPQLQQTYSTHITASASIPALVQLLDSQIMPSLLVREFVFLALDNGTARVLLARGVEMDCVPTVQARDLLLPLVGSKPGQPLLAEPRFGWIRLVLPLRLEQELLGFWLFGRRDPDDLYSSLEIPLLQSFANQAAIALSNILQSDRLRALYQADIDRHEQERLDLARELHDRVLNELAGMLMSVDLRTLPRNFREGYRALTQRLREIVSDLRPPMLSYGLRAAIQELADNLMERSKDTVDIVLSLEPGECRYPLDKEQHLFRIVQGACENAVLHSRGRRVTISGRLDEAGVELRVEDDGVGFRVPGENIDLNELLSQRHFGLAGMYERAELIGAEIRIQSAPGQGTRVSLRWRADEERPAQPPGRS